MTSKLSHSRQPFITGFLLSSLASIALSQVNFWQATNVPFGSSILSLAVNSRDWIFAGAAGEGILRSTDMGNTWIQLNISQGVSSVNALIIDRDRYLLAGTDSGIWRSTDDGTNWSNASKGLTNLSVMTLAINADGNIFAGTWNGGFRSTDTGHSWMALRIGAIPCAVICFAFNSRGVIFAGTNEWDICGRLHRSSNGGNDWVRLQLPCVRSLWIDSTDTPWAGIGELWCSWYLGFIARLTVDGERWAAIQRGPKNTAVNSIFIGPGGHLFAGTCSGVFRSTDNGESFAQINTGLSDTRVGALVIDSKGHLFAGTESGTIFRSIQPITAVQMRDDEIPAALSVEQNYPNPFNPRTTITFHIRSASYVTLKIFNMLGQEVATLVNAVEEPGYKSVEFSAGNLASGIYFYRLQVGEFAATKKLLLLR